MNIENNVYYRFRFKISEERFERRYYICDYNEKSALKHLWEGFSEYKQKKIKTIVLEEIVKVKESEMYWTSSLFADKNHLNEYTYEDYLKLIELQKMRDRLLTKLHQKNLDQYYRLRAVSALRMDLRIGCLNGLHPKWMAKHWPEFCIGEVVMSIDKHQSGDGYDRGASHIINQSFKIG